MEDNHQNSSKTEDSSFTFRVDDVQICKEPPRNMRGAQEALKSISNIKGRIEDFSHKRNTETEFLTDEVPGILCALHTAYMSHYPLKLSVSDFIILIGQGVGLHIDRNAEKVRKHFVNHKSRKTIEVRRDEFSIGQKDNDWSTIFGAFAEEIKRNVKTDIYDIVIDDTSVATPTSRIVSEIALMDAMKHYFKQELFLLCGIPTITLEGHPEDWKKLRQKVKKLEDMNKDDCLGLNWWLKELVPVIEKICETGINRKADQKFWSNIYKYTEDQADYDMIPYVSGWIRVFFPYLINSVNNFAESHLNATTIPKQISQVPFVCRSLDMEFSMKFYGGFIGARFDKDAFYVEPVLAWVVVEEEEKGLNIKKLYKKFIDLFSTQSKP